VSSMPRLVLDGMEDEPVHDRVSEIERIDTPTRPSFWAVVGRGLKRKQTP